MANQEQVARLKRSVKEWNIWRLKYPKIHPDLSGADLSNIDLSFTHFHVVRENPVWTNDTYEADMVYDTIPEYETRSSADLSSTDLSGANLSHADLGNVNLSRTYLSDTNFSGAYFSRTLFAEVNLSNAKGLDTTNHRGPSWVDINSVTLPQDETTRKHFLRGVGFTETQIEYLPSLLTPRPLQYHSLFISYASQDEAIARRLYTDLRKKDVPCWMAPHDLCPGIPILRGIEEAIHLHDKFLLVLSKHAVRSAWIEREVDAALHEEIMRSTDVLFPIRLDNTILESNAGWAIRLQHRHIGDFTGWQDNTAYQQAFSGLLQHLKVNRSPTR